MRIVGKINFNLVTPQLIEELVVLEQQGFKCEIIVDSKGKNILLVR